LGIVILSCRQTGTDFGLHAGLSLKRIFVWHWIYAFAFSEVSPKTPSLPYRLKVGRKQQHQLAKVNFRSFLFPVKKQDDAVFHSVEGLGKVDFIR